MPVHVRCTRNKGSKQKHAERMRWLGTCILISSMTAAMYYFHFPPPPSESPPNNTTCWHTECQPSLLTGEPFIFSQSVFFLSQCPSDVVEDVASRGLSEIPDPCHCQIRLGIGRAVTLFCDADSGTVMFGVRRFTSSEIRPDTGVCGIKLNK